MPDLFVPEETPSQPNQPTATPTSVRVTPALQPGKMLYPFSAYRENPTNVTFNTQEADEQILLFLRAHIITNLDWILTTIALFLFPPVVNLLFMIGGDLLPFELSSIPTQFLVMFLLFYYLIAITFMFASFLIWFYNIGIVTQKRIIDIDYRDLIYHNVALTKLNLVEDVSYTQGGFFASLFNFGTINIQTAGETKHFEFNSVPQPARATDIIEDLIGGPRHA